MQSTTYHDRGPAIEARRRRRLAQAGLRRRMSWTGLLLVASILALSAAEGA